MAASRFLTKRLPDVSISHEGNKRKMFYSGVLVTAAPGKLEKAVQSVEGKGLEIYHRDPDAERFIAVIEGETIQSEADIFKELISLPGIQNVSLVTNLEDTEEEQQ